MINDAHEVTSDIEASNDVIHMLNRVIVPPPSDRSRRRSQAGPLQLPRGAGRPFRKSTVDTRDVTHR
jgi:hypothetical protein